MSTEQLYTKVIHNSPGSLTESELKQARSRLEALKYHPRDEESNRLLLARGERMYSMSIGSKREYLNNILGEFERVLNKQDASEIKKTRIKLAAVLDELDSQEWF